MRCKEEWIDRLEDLKWWELPEDVIRENFDLFKAELSDEIICKMESIKENNINS